VFVLRVRQRARRRDDRQEGACDLHFGCRGLEIGDVALDLHIRVAELAVDDEARAEPLVQPRKAVVFRVEFGEGDAILPTADGRHGVLGLFRGQRPGGDAGEAVVNVKGPVAALAELAVADDVDARVGLLAHDSVDRILQTGLVGGFIVGFAILDLVQELDELRGADQAADVGSEDAVGGRCHFAPSWPWLVSSSPYHLRTARAATISGAKSGVSKRRVRIARKSGSVSVCSAGRSRYCTDPVQPGPGVS